LNEREFLTGTRVNGEKPPGGLNRFLYSLNVVHKLNLFGARPSREPVIEILQRLFPDTNVDNILNELHGRDYLIEKDGTLRATRKGKAVATYWDRRRII